MEQTGKIFLKWVYTPADFFEVKITDLLPDYEHIIENGEISVSMDLEEYQRNPSIHRQLHEKFINYFKGAILVSQMPYTLNQAGIQIFHRDGKEERIIQAEALLKATSSLKVDCCFLDSSGELITDTKQDRLKKRNRLATLAEKYGNSDPLAESLLNSFEKSLNNPNTALVHLFEIRDSLAKRFSGEENAEKEIGISDKKWDRLGILSNAKPLNQGRHSGQYVGELRDATESELKEARDIAVEMMVGYFEYLEKNA